MSAPERDECGTAEPVDELAARRCRGVGSADTLSPRNRRTYGSVLELLADADHLVNDLAEPGTRALLVPADELAFVSRRIRALLDAAAVELHRAGGA